MNNDYIKNVKQAELRRLIRKLGMRYASAKYKSEEKKDQFAMFHFAQQLAYEDCISIIKEIFEDELPKEDFET